MFEGLPEMLQKCFNADFVCQNNTKFNAETKLLKVLIFIMKLCLVCFYRCGLKCPQKYLIEGSVVSLQRKSDKSSKNLYNPELLYTACEIVYKDHIIKWGLKCSSQRDHQVLIKG